MAPNRHFGDDSAAAADHGGRSVKRKCDVLGENVNEIPSCNWLNLSRCRRNMVVVLIVVLMVAAMDPVSGQVVTRDPRFYSREGDYSYQWPNPGDPEYR